MGETNEISCSVRTARDLDRLAHPAIPATWRLSEPIYVGPADAGASPPVAVGFLSDMPTGDSLADYLDPIILAFEDAVHESRLRHRVRIEASHVRGLPTGRPEAVLAAFHDLV